jgi:hypothetical protein
MFSATVETACPYPFLHGLPIGGHVLRLGDLPRLVDLAGRTHDEYMM